MASASRKLLKDLPSPDEIWSAVQRLNRENHRTVAILGGAYLDYAIQVYLQACFVTLPKEDLNRMFDAGQNGFLSTFAAKLRLCRALGLIGGVSYDNLTILNDIRNVFAHSMHKIDFGHPLVVQDCAKLNLSRFYKLDAEPREPVERFCGAIDGIYLGLRHAAIKSRFSFEKPNALLD